MNDRINPSSITRPIQLLAAWLVGLLVIDGAFLTAAAKMSAHSTEQLILTWAAVANVPIFIIALFLLQTRFRPELQEDSFYSRYLDKKTNQIVTVSRDKRIELGISALREQVSLLSLETTAPNNIDDDRPETSAVITRRLGHHWKIAVNDQLDNFSKIREVLRDRDIPISDIFGSENETGKPDFRVMTLSHEIDFVSKKELLLLADELGMDAYNYFDPDEPEITEPILIGSYGYKLRPAIEITSNLYRTLREFGDALDLKSYENKNRLSLTE